MVLRDLRGLKGFGLLSFPTRLGQIENFHLSVSHSLAHSLSLSLSLSVSLSLSLSLSLSVRPSVRPSVRASVRPSVRPSVRLSLFLSLSHSISLYFSRLIKAAPRLWALIPSSHALVLGSTNVVSSSANGTRRTLPSDLCQSQGGVMAFPRQSCPPRATRIPRLGPLEYHNPPLGPREHHVPPPGRAGEYCTPGMLEGAARFAIQRQHRIKAC